MSKNNNIPTKDWQFFVDNPFFVQGLKELKKNVPQNNGSPGWFFETAELLIADRYRTDIPDKTKIRFIEMHRQLYKPAN